MIDNELVELYQENKASEMKEELLIIELMSALEGDEVQRERAIALTYELRDRSSSFEN